MVSVLSSMGKIPKSFSLEKFFPDNITLDMMSGRLITAEISQTQKCALLPCSTVRGARPNKRPTPLSDYPSS